MRAFVTGSTGLLGSNLVRALVERGDDVVGLVRSEERGRRLIGDTGARLVVGDMRDVAGFAAALDGCEVVFHTAAYFREYYHQGDHASALEEINVTGTLALMAEADRRGVRRLVHTSSSGAIGTTGDGSEADENTPPGELQRSNLYFRSKVDGAAAIGAWQRVRELEVVEVLPGWMWGPGDAGPTAAGQLVIDFLGRQIPAVPDGGTSVVDARDVAAAMIAAAERGRAGERYIVAGAYCEVADILRGLEQETGVAGPQLQLPYFLIYGFAYCAELFGWLTGTDVLVTREAVRVLHERHRLSSTKATRELGVTFRPLAETLRDAVAWQRAHRLPAPAA
jgi:nucleoside-diphosphate-sugar epimerase